MMGKWLELAAELEANGANGAIGDEGPAPAVFGIEQVREGVASLKRMGMPRRAVVTVRREAAADAGAILDRGWAERALSLGWGPLDLFGCEPAGSDDDYRNGLAVWLERRPIVLVDADGAIARTTNGHAYFNRNRDRTGAVLLWNLK